MKNIFIILLLVLLIFSTQTYAQKPFQFEVTISDSLNIDRIDGRLLLIISDNNAREPRFQIDVTQHTQQIFGIDIDQFSPGKKAVIDSSVFGYPLPCITLIPPGEYWVQAVLHRYETFHRSDGHTIKLPMDRGEGQQWSWAPGNLYSVPKKVKINPKENGAVAIQLSQVCPPAPKLQDTRYIKHIQIQSKRLSAFWGRPMHLGAVLLLPYGFKEHPNSRYPLMINHDHHRFTFHEFRPEPPDSQSHPQRRHYQEMAYQFYKKWTSPNFPRVVLMLIKHANPYYDDSYAVNSANLGPYGDAINTELIPYVESQFHCIGEGWARTVYGGSTGGWASLAVQIFYPDFFNGCWAGCPDPVDFRGHGIVNIYQDENAYLTMGTWKHTLKPCWRADDGGLICTVQEENHLELVLGTHGRSGGQWDVWQAVFGPVGDDGYPRPIWDKRTGDIDSKTAVYWREHSDLHYILKRDWEELGSKLKGKIHIATGDHDSFYLNNAVHFLEDFLESTTDPYYDGEIVYKPGEGHCWMGEMTDPETGKAVVDHEYFIPRMVEHVIKTAPPNADITSWRY